MIKTKDELYRTFGIVIIFFIMVLTMIAMTGLNVIDKYIDSHSPQPIEQVKATPINMPKPTKGYFVECMHDDVALVFHKDVQYYCTCERGKWVYKEVPHDKNYRNFELPKSFKHHAGTL